MLLKKLNKITLFYKKSYSIVKGYKKLIILFFIIYLVSFLGGYFFADFNKSFSFDIKQRALSDLSENRFFTAIISEIKAKNIEKAIFFTFLFNLIWGAFISTTLVGLIFFLPFLVAFSRGFLVGLVFSGSLLISPYYFGIVFLTMIFEFSAYILSSVYGVILGTSFLFPQKFGKREKSEAFLKIIKEFPYFYFFVVLFLLIGAIWEIFGIIKLMEIF